MDAAGHFSHSYREAHSHAAVLRAGQALACDRAVQ